MLWKATKHQHFVPHDQVCHTACRKWIQGWKMDVRDFCMPVIAHKYSFHTEFPPSSGRSRQRTAKTRGETRKVPYELNICTLGMAYVPNVLNKSYTPSLNPVCDVVISVLAEAHSIIKVVALECICGATQVSHRKKSLRTSLRKWIKALKFGIGRPSRPFILTAT